MCLFAFRTPFDLRSFKWNNPCIDYNLVIEIMGRPLILFNKSMYTQSKIFLSIEMCMRRGSKVRKLLLNSNENKIYILHSIRFFKDWSRKAWCSFGRRGIGHGCLLFSSQWSSKVRHVITFFTPLRKLKKARQTNHNIGYQVLTNTAHAAANITTFL